MSGTLKPPQPKLDRSRLSSSDISELYDILISELTDFVVVLIDREGNFASWNVGVLMNLGYTEQEFIGKPFSIIFTPEEAASEAPAREIAVAADKGRSADIRWHVRKDGTRFFADGVLVALRSPDRELLGFSKVVRDITESKRREERLLRANDELQHFVYAATHDLKEPLRIIRTFSEMLSSQFAATFGQEGGNALNTIQSAAARMDHLIHSALDYSRTGKPVMREVRVDEVVNTALLNLQSSIEHEHAQVTSDPLPTVYADPARLMQLFQNLISNAIKFHSQEAPMIHIGVESGEDDWIFCVRDNGIGFDPQYAEQIFQPFERLHGFGVAGSGIGLAICKRIAESQGGTIWAESQPGRGSAFYFTVPRTQ